jgi:hypothetical protein
MPDNDEERCVAATSADSAATQKRPPRRLNARNAKCFTTRQASGQWPEVPDLEAINRFCGTSLGSSDFQLALLPQLARVLARLTPTPIAFF